jgi:hypothetical protein
VASIEEIVTALQAAIDKLDETIGATGAAVAEAEEMVGQMAAAGVLDKVTEFAAVKDAIESARSYLAGGVDLLNAAMEQAKAAGGG